MFEFVDACTSCRVGGLPWAEVAALGCVYGFAWGFVAVVVWVAITGDAET